MTKDWRGGAAGGGRGRYDSERTGGGSPLGIVCAPACANDGVNNDDHARPGIDIKEGETEVKVDDVGGGKAPA